MGNTTISNKKEKNMHTPEQITEEIQKLPLMEDSQLVHYMKIISSKQTAKEKKLYEPLYKAIEKERRKRGTASVISTKIVQPRATKSSSVSDSYEGVNHDEV